MTGKPPNRYGWRDKLAEGAAGAERVAEALRAQGLAVSDVQGDPAWQGVDVDFLVNGSAVEVKTERRAETNIFLELTCGSGPGAVYKSRADVWVYYIAHQDIILIFALDALHDWLRRHAHEYEVKVVESRAGSRTWRATGIAVPIQVLRRQMELSVFPVPRPAPAEAEEAAA